MNAAPIFLRGSRLEKKFGNVVAVHDLELQLRAGEVFGLLGPNGAGNSATVNMICGLLPPDQVELVFNGLSLDPWDPAMRAPIGVCPQEIILWPKLVCLEQLQFMAQMYTVPARTAAATSIIRNPKRRCLAAITCDNPEVPCGFVSEFSSSCH